jgi:hypothetical protein
MFLSIPIFMISVKNQDNLVASEKGLDYATDGDGNARWIVDADREGCRWHIVQSDELLTAFLQLEAMFSAETIPGSSHANIWAAGIESASSGRHKMLYPPPLEHTIYGNCQTSTDHDRTLHERRNQYINSSKRNKIKTLDRQNGQEEGKH